MTIESIIQKTDNRYNQVLKADSSNNSGKKKDAALFEEFSSVLDKIAVQLSSIDEFDYQSVPTQATPPAPKTPVKAKEQSSQKEDNDYERISAEDSEKKVVKEEAKNEEIQVEDQVQAQQSVETEVKEEAETEEIFAEEEKVQEDETEEILEASENVQLDEVGTEIIDEAIVKPQEIVSDPAYTKALTKEVVKDSQDQEQEQVVSQHVASEAKDNIDPNLQSKAKENIVETKLQNKQFEDTNITPEENKSEADQLANKFFDQLKETLLKKNEQAEAKLNLESVENNLEAVAPKITEIATTNPSIVVPVLNFQAQESQLSKEALKLNTTVIQSANTTDGSSAKTATAALREAVGTSKGAKLTQSQASRTMAKVEDALKEVAKSKDGKTISVRLDPPKLGSVKIDVSLRDGNLHARIVAESPQVNNLLREKGHELQMVLRKIGIDAEAVSVSVGSDRNFDDGNKANSGTGQGRNGSNSGQTDEGLGEDFISSAGSEVATSKPALEDHWIA